MQGAMASSAVPVREFKLAGSLTHVVDVHCELVSKTAPPYVCARGPQMHLASTQCHLPLASSPASDLARSGLFFFFLKKKKKNRRWTTQWASDPLVHWPSIITDGAAAAGGATPARERLCYAGLAAPRPGAAAAGGSVPAAAVAAAGRRAGLGVAHARLFAAGARAAARRARGQHHPGVDAAAARRAGHCLVRQRLAVGRHERKEEAKKKEQIN